MKKLFLCLALCWFTTGAFSQKIYFAYLQSESGQPFFVRMNDKVHSSTGAGYLILSRLLDSNYSINLGFPGQNLPEQKFTISVNKKDHGYLLKDFGEKGWGLFDLQSLNVQMSSSAIASTKPGDNNDVSPFTQILSKAADDPSLTEKTVKPEEKKKEEVAQQPPKNQEPVPVVTTAPVTNPVINNAVTIAKDETEKKEPVKEKEEVKTVTAVEKPATEPVNKEEVPVPVSEKPIETVEKVGEGYKPSQISKINESKNDEGHNMVFVDKFADGKTDTIRVLIPGKVNKSTPDAEKPKEEKKFLDIAVEPAKQSTVPETSQETKVKKDVQPEVTPITEEPRKYTIKNTCSGTASESDFLKLRRKMAAADNDDDMISEARKYFKSDCFSVYQIRNLSTLFLGDEGKYKFFDAAYPFSSDAHNFISLQLELKESYYINRFKAMIK